MPPPEKPLVVQMMEDRLAKKQREEREAAEKKAAAEAAAEATMQEERKRSRRLSVLEAKNQELMKNRAELKKKQEQEEEKEQQERTQRLTDLAKTKEEKERKNREAMERKEALALTIKMAEVRAKELASAERQQSMSHRNNASLASKFAKVTINGAGDDPELRRIRVDVESGKMQVNVIDGVKWAVNMSDGTDRFKLTGTTLEMLPHKGEYVTRQARTTGSDSTRTSIDSTTRRSMAIEDKAAKWLSSLKS